MAEEDREFTRVRPRFDAALAFGASVVSGHTRDICMKGLYIECRQGPPLNTSCTVAIYLGGPGGAARIEAHGRVVRVDARGVAVAFTEIDGLESYAHLRQLILLNADEADRIERELEQHIGIVRSRRRVRRAK